MEDLVIKDECMGCDVVRLCLLGIAELGRSALSPEKLREQWRALRFAGKGERQRILGEIAAANTGSHDTQHACAEAVHILELGVQTCPANEEVEGEVQLHVCMNSVSAQWAMLGPVREITEQTQQNNLDFRRVCTRITQAARPQSD
jgi:hypothetical protein